MARAPRKVPPTTWTGSVLDSFRLDEKVALVTGGGSGLGAAIAMAFASAGAKVAVFDVDEAGATKTASAIREAGAVVAIERVDVCDADQVRNAVASIEGQFGKVDILVNSAGISGRAPAMDYDVERFRRILDVNVVGSFVTSQAVGPGMASHKDGRIINIASIASVVGYVGNPAYIASKGGVSQLTKALAIEWARLGIRVNAIAPGTIETELALRQIAAEPAFFDAFRERHPIGRFGRPHEVVGAAVFLASDASSFVTGHTLVVDGGYTAQ